MRTVGWTFKTYSDKGKGKSAENHYPCMTIDDIYNLPVQDIADKDCVLLMWVSYPLLKEGIKTTLDYIIDNNIIRNSIINVYMIDVVL